MARASRFSMSYVMKLSEKNVQFPDRPISLPEIFICGAT